MPDIIATSEHEIVACIQLQSIEARHDRQFRLSDGAVHDCNHSIAFFIRPVLRPHVLPIVRSMLALKRLLTLIVLTPQVAGTRQYFANDITKSVLHTKRAERVFVTVACGDGI